MMIRMMRMMIHAVAAAASSSSLCRLLLPSFFVVGFHLDHLRLSHFSSYVDDARWPTALARLTHSSQALEDLNNAMLTIHKERSYIYIYIYIYQTVYDETTLYS